MIPWMRIITKDEINEESREMSSNNSLDHSVCSGLDHRRSKRAASFDVI